MTTKARPATATAPTIQTTGDTPEDGARSRADGIDRESLAFDLKFTWPNDTPPVRCALSPDDAPDDAEADSDGMAISYGVRS